jgi:tRNA pseudouridine38-40 synthase
MPNFRLTLEYDGSDFEGWQMQGPERRTVQGTLERAIARITAQRVDVIGAGRTDAGVHAEGQVASARIETRLQPLELQRALNAVLPGDLAARSVDRAPERFHARRDAVSKLYRYRIWNGEQRSPLRQRHSLWIRKALDLEAMIQAAAALRGRHDFASFQGAGSSPWSTDRTIRRVALLGESGHEVSIEVEGDGFLRHMVRNLAGTLLEVGRGRRAPDSIPALLAARDRRLSGPTAAAWGLTLVRVDYGGRTTARRRREVSAPAGGLPSDSAPFSRG